MKTLICHLLWVVTMASCNNLAAQNTDKVKIPLPGLFENDQIFFDSRPATVSSDGRIIALTNYNGYAILDVDSMTFKMLTVEKNGRISPDFSFIYNNMPSMTEAARIVYPPQNSRESRWTSFTRGALISEPLKEFKNEHYILAMDGDNNYITTNPWMIVEDNDNYIGGMVGVFLVDRKTGATIKTLRSDTIYKRKPKQFNFTYRHFYFNKTYTVMLADADGPMAATVVYPFGTTRTDTLHGIRIQNNWNVTIDGRYLYEKTTSRYGGIRDNLYVWDIQAPGRHVFQTEYKSPLTYQPPAYGPNLFAFHNDHIFRYDREKNIVFEEILEGDQLKVLNQWKIDLKGNLLANSQRFNMIVAKGPSLFIYPMSRSSATNELSNNAFLINLESKDLVMRINPYFNPSAATLAREKQVEYANAESAAKQKKEAEDKLAAKIKANWTDKGFVRGRTYLFGDSYIIMDSYDPKKDEYKFWQPRQRYQGNGSYMEERVVTVVGYGFRDKDYSSHKQFHTCSACEGNGGFEYTEYTTKTKDLPWGYFSGIETKKITTTATKRVKICTACDGQGVVLK